MMSPHQSRSSAAPGKVPAIIYARYSTERQDACSIEDQLRRCKKFAQSSGRYEVVGEFNDEAASGATLDRPGLRRLLAEARSGRGCRFRAVLVDDLSRLSRDLGDTWNLIFSSFEAEDIVVVDVTTGMASDNPAARVTFGSMALVNDMVRQSVRSQTHRGLEGRALEGFHTGGRCYGYDTPEETDPKDKEHPRHRIVINPDEGTVVRRIFEQRAAGARIGRIVRDLNHNRVPGPYDALGYKKHATGKGWSAYQVRYMLLNERYIGRIVWNKRKWVRDPVTKKRKWKERDPSEWVTVERPDLRIVDATTWDAVQKTFRSNTPRKLGRPAGSSAVVKHAHLLTGVLRCGVCGGSFTVLGMKEKRGRKYWQLGCSTNREKGDTTCPNRKRISMNIVQATVLDSIIEYVGSEQFNAWAANALDVEERVAEKKAEDDPRPVLQRQIELQEARVAHVADAVAQEGFSEALRRLLRAEEQKLRDLRTKLADLKNSTRARPKVPRLDPSRVIALVRMADAVRDANPLAAREALHQVVDRVVLKPSGPDGEYEAEVTLKEETAALAGGRPVVPEFAGNRSCGGRI